MSHQYYKSLRNPQNSGFTPEEKEIADRSVSDALEALDSHPRCKELFTGNDTLALAVDPANMLREIQAKGGFQRGSPTETDIARTAVAAKIPQHSSSEQQIL